MSKSMLFIGLSTVVALALDSTPVAAQAGVAWVTFSNQPSHLALPALSVSDSGTQVRFRTGDLNKDGWEDVVVVRKQPASQLGKKTAILLINDHGVLRDKTSAWATASDVFGDMGFLTPCNNTSVAIGDVNGDGWPDVVTCVALSDGATKAISHPRVYINRGTNAAGRWLGLRYEAARFPQLLTVGGLAVAPRFSELALGDVNGDGSLDIYFVDFDTTETNIVEPALWDLNDRLLVNDGNGFFTDQSAAALTATQLKSSFGSDVQLTDINNDGVLDIAKVSFLEQPLIVRLIYNNPANVGNFTTSGFSDAGSPAPEAAAVGDLNKDAFKDLVIGDDVNDRFRFGTGFNASNQMLWGPLKSFSFVSGGDDGFARHVYIRDLDGNGWNDVFITCVDADLPVCNLRLHFYHNTGSVPGDMNLVIKEEAELANGGSGTGWKGVVGITAADEKGCYDVGMGDFDKDGDLDLILGTCSGTQYFQNETSTFADLGSGSPGVDGGPLLAGAGALTVHSSGALTLSHAAPFAMSTLFVSADSQPANIRGGTLVPVPWVIAQSSSTDASGALPLSWSSWPAGLSGTSLYFQYVVRDAAAGGLSLSNALRADVP